MICTRWVCLIQSGTTIIIKAHNQGRNTKRSTSIALCIALWTRCKVLTFLPSWNVISLVHMKQHKTEKTLHSNLTYNWLLITTYHWENAIPKYSGIKFCSVLYWHNPSKVCTGVTDSRIWLLVRHEVHYSQLGIN